MAGLIIGKGIGNLFRDYGFDDTNAGTQFAMAKYYADKLWYMRSDRVDMAQAIEWYKKAALQDHAQALAALEKLAGDDSPRYSTFVS
ncbi:MAG: hypothetical protein K940chlam8_00715 [Chlamydiae bacterium]|nr:hypothetical protein [Chlamydiota bacterium]